MAVLPTNGPAKWAMVEVEVGDVKRLSRKLTGQVKAMCPMGHVRFLDRMEHQPPRVKRSRRRRGF